MPAVAGSWVDRNGPRRLIARSALTAGLSVAVFATISMLRDLSPNALLLLSFVWGILNGALRVGVFALTPALVGQSELSSINGRQQVAFQAGQLAGVLSGGALLDRIGMAGSLGLIGACMAAAAAFYSRASLGWRVDATCSAVIGPPSLGELIGCVVRSPAVMAVVLLGTADAVVIALFNLTLPLIGERHLGGGSALVAVIGAIYACGAMAFGWAVKRFALDIHHLHKSILLMPILAVAAVSQLQFFAFPVYVVVAAALGAATALYTIYFTTTVQAIVSVSIRGRFAAIRRMVSAIVVGTCSLVFAASYSHAGTAMASFVAALTCLVILGASIAWTVSRVEQSKTRHCDLQAMIVPPGGITR